MPNNESHHVIPQSGTGNEISHDTREEFEDRQDMREARGENDSIPWNSAVICAKVSHELVYSTVSVGRTAVNRKQ